MFNVWDGNIIKALLLAKLGRLIRLSLENLSLILDLTMKESVASRYQLVRAVVVPLMSPRQCETSWHSWAIKASPG